MRDLRNHNQLGALKAPTLLTPDRDTYDSLVMGHLEDILRAKGLDEAVIRETAGEVMREVIEPERMYARQRGES